MSGATPLLPFCAFMTSTGKLYIFKRTANSIDGSVADRVPKHKESTNSVQKKNIYIYIYISVNAIAKARHLTLSWARVGVVYLSLITLSVLTTILWTMAFYGKRHRAVTFQRNVLLTLGGKMMGAAITCVNLLWFYQNVRCHASEKAIFIYTDVFQIYIFFHSNTIFPCFPYQRPMFTQESNSD